MCALQLTDIFSIQMMHHCVLWKPDPKKTDQTGQVTSFSWL